MDKDNATMDKAPTIHASSFGRVYACPASARMELQYESKSTPDSERGERLHGIMERGGLTPEVAEALNPDDREAIANASAKISEIIQNFGLDAPDTEVIRERHLEYCERGEKILSGRVDQILYSPSNNSTDIIDYKFGSVSVEDAESNKQLACYAVLWEHEKGEALNAKHVIRVHIIAPCAIGKKYSVAEYRVDDIRSLWKPAIIEVCQYARGASEARLADDVGEYCRYCKAMADCPKQRHNVEVVLHAGDELNGGKLEITRDNAIDIFNQLSEWNKRRLIAEKCVDAIKANLEAYVNESGDERFDWKAGAKSINYTANAVYGYYQQLIPADKFVDFCKPNITQIIDFVSKASKTPKAQCKRELDDAIVAGGATFRQNKPSLILKQDNRKG